MRLKVSYLYFIGSTRHDFQKRDNPVLNGTYSYHTLRKSLYVKHKILNILSDFTCN